MVLVPLADPAAEQLRQEWIAAKRARDYTTADRVRTQLRAMGIHEDEAWWRPGAPVAAGAGAAAAGAAPQPAPAAADGQSTLVAQLRAAWEAARSAGDTATADALKAQLSKKGVEVGGDEPPELADPDPERPQQPAPAAQQGYQCPGCHQPWVPTAENACQYCGYGRQGGEGVEELKRTWVAAKQSRDYATADAARAQLRALGIEPQDAWWMDRTGRALSVSVNQQQVDALKLQWIEAKKMKDWTTSDAVRARLRELGIEPDEGWLRLPQFAGPPAPAYPPQPLAAPPLQYPPQAPLHPAPMQQPLPPTSPWLLYPQAEGLKQQWIAAKRARDYATADAVRAQLRALGIQEDERWWMETPPLGGHAPVHSAPHVPQAAAVPSGGWGQPGGGWGTPPEITQLAEAWVAAKRARSFETSDSIRAQLRAQGYDANDNWLRDGIPPVIPPGSNHRSAPY